MNPQGSNREHLFRGVNQPDSPEVQRDVLLIRLLALMSPSQRSEVRAKSRTKTVEEAVLEWAADLVNSQHNLQQAVDDAVEVARKLAYDLGNA